MNEIVVNLTVDEINKIMDAITVACGESPNYNSTKDMFYEKCINQGVVFNKESVDQAFFYITDIAVESIDNKEQSLLEYSVVENNGDYFVVGQSCLSLKFNNREDAEKECKILNQEILEDE